MRAFARRRPDVGVAALRFTNFIGPRIDSVLTSFFRMPVVPTALGYDARVQLLHEDDALAVLHPRDDRRLRRHRERRRRRHAAALAVHPPARPPRAPDPHSGARLGRPALPPLRLRRLLAEQMRFLNFGRVVDTTVLREKFGYTPRYTTEAALADYARTVPPVVPPGWSASATSGVRSALDRAGDTASAVGRRLRPRPPRRTAGGARCLRPASSRCGPTTTSPSSRRTPRRAGRTSSPRGWTSCAAG